MISDLMMALEISCRIMTFHMSHKVSQVTSHVLSHNMSYHFGDGKKNLTESDSTQVMVAVLVYTRSHNFQSNVIYFDYVL